MLSATGGGHPGDGGSAPSSTAGIQHPRAHAFGLRRGLWREGKSPWGLGALCAEGLEKASLRSSEGRCLGQGPRHRGQKACTPGAAGSAGHRARTGQGSDARMRTWGSTRQAVCPRCSLAHWSQATWRT